MPRAAANPAKRGRTPRFSEEDPPRAAASVVALTGKVVNLGRCGPQYGSRCASQRPRADHRRDADLAVAHGLLC